MIGCRAVRATPAPQRKALAITEAQVGALAAAVTVESRARLLTVDGSGRKVAGGWTTIEEAVGSHLAFMVVPSANTLAVDADTPEQIRELPGLARAIAGYGVVPVLVRSGRGQHLFARMPPKWVD